jgi:NAD(P)-dependent dehydrogenase (short-subunit alcohol dehydrogenase family)
MLPPRRHPAAWKCHMTSVLITGAYRGLGFEFARQYAADGWRVLAACRDPASAGELQRLRRSTGMLAIVPMDVTDAETVRYAATQLNDVAIDAIANSAGIAGTSGQSVGNVDYDSWSHVFDVNTMGPLRVIDLYRPYCRWRAQAGRHHYERHGLARRQHVRRLDSLSQLQGGREHGQAKHCDRSSAARHQLCSRQSRLGQDRYGWPWRDANAAGECDSLAATHRHVRPQSFGQVLSLRWPRISMVSAERRRWQAGGVWKRRLRPPWRTASSSISRVRTSAVADVARAGRLPRSSARQWAQSGTPLPALSDH